MENVNLENIMMFRNNKSIEIQVNAKNFLTEITKDRLVKSYDVTCHWIFISQARNSINNRKMFSLPNCMKCHLPVVMEKAIGISVMQCDGHKNCFYCQIQNEF